MEKNSTTTKSTSHSSSLVPYERNFEEQKLDGKAALCLCSFSLQKIDYKTSMELKAIKGQFLEMTKKCEKKKKAECGPVNVVPSKHLSIPSSTEFMSVNDELILPDFPPVKSLVGQIGNCSKPFAKQLTESDLKDNQNRFLINTVHAHNHLLPLLRPEEDLDNGIPVTVYDSEGKTHQMTFKVWHRKSHVLIGHWVKFARNHGFQEGIDWVVVWMFRHRQSDELCFVIISTRIPKPKLEMQSRRKRTAPPPKKLRRVESPASLLKTKRTIIGSLHS